MSADGRSNATSTVPARTCVGRVGRVDSAQLKRHVGVALRPDPSPLRGRPAGDVPEGEETAGSPHQVTDTLNPLSRPNAQSMKPATAAKKLDV